MPESDEPDAIESPTTDGVTLAKVGEALVEMNEHQSKLKGYADNLSTITLPNKTSITMAFKLVIRALKTQYKSRYNEDCDGPERTLHYMKLQT